MNDTKREVHVHPGTEVYGVKCDMEIIHPLQERTFYLPPNTYARVKMWNYGERKGISILVSAEQEA